MIFQTKQRERSNDLIFQLLKQELWIYNDTYRKMDPWSAIAHYLIPAEHLELLRLDSQAIPELICLYHGCTGTHEPACRLLVRLPNQTDRTGNWPQGCGVRVLALCLRVMQALRPPCHASARSGWTHEDICSATEREQATPPLWHL